MRSVSSSLFLGLALYFTFSMNILALVFFLSVFLHSRFGLHIVFGCQRSSVLSNLSAFNLSIDLRKLQKVLRAGVHFSFLTPNSSFPLVEMRGLEPLAYALQRHRSPS